MLLRKSIGTGCICNKYLRYAIECNATVEAGGGGISIQLILRPDVLG